MTGLFVCVLFRFIAYAVISGEWRIVFPSEKKLSGNTIWICGAFHPFGVQVSAMTTKRNNCARVTSESLRQLPADWHRLFLLQINRISIASCDRKCCATMKEYFFLIGIVFSHILASFARYNKLNIHALIIYFI